MNFKIITQCNDSLNFQALNSPISPIGYSWKSLALTHCDHKSFQWLDSSEEFLDILKIAYPKLSFAEICQLFEQVIKHQIPISFESLLSKYHMKYTIDVEKLYSILIFCSKDFLNWSAQKDLGIMDFKPLLLVDSIPNQSLSYLAKLNPNRFQGVKILEWLLMDYNENLAQAFMKAKTADEAYNFLYQTRFPNAYQNDIGKSNVNKSLPWPSHVKTQWIRKGDLSGLELEFFTTNYEDFCQKLEKLNSMKEKVKELWK